MKVKEESEKVSLKLNIKTKIVASSPITSWEIDGETVETVWDFIFLGSKITTDGDCSQEIKRCLLLGRKVMTNLDSILKSRDITLPTQVHLVTAMIFPVGMYGCESWTIKKAGTNIHGPNIPGSYAILLFTASHFISITSHIHNWLMILKNDAFELWCWRRLLRIPWTAKRSTTQS